VNTCSVPGSAITLPCRRHAAAGRWPPNANWRCRLLAVVHGPLAAWALAALWLAGGLAQAQPAAPLLDKVAPAARVALPQARFAVGDNPAWAEPGFDDRAWKTLSTAEPWEAQGYEGHDGFAWYRIHVVIPAALRDGSDWPERLRLQLPAIDDADEVFLNGTRVGKSGRMPGDPGGFEGRPQSLRDYLVDLRAGPVRWDQNNVIAVRVYDEGGMGGLHGGTPWLSVPRRAEGVQVDQARWRHRFVGSEDVQTTVVLNNRFPVQQQGELHVQALDQASGRVVLRAQQRVDLAADQSTEVELSLPARPGIEASIRYVDLATGQAFASTLIVPYVLTPPDPPAPALHGASVLGARPGTPLHHRVPATGSGPLRFTAQGLPPGLELDGNSGVISGTVPAAGRYTVRLTAHNELGSAWRDWTLVAGEQLALTPPMAWNSWHAHGANSSAALVREAAQALIDQGLAAKGWSGVHVDDGWQAARRLADGSLPGNERFPDMPGLGRYLHERGLQFGLYSSPGATTCARYPGSLGFEARDAATWAGWGVDHLRYDLCSYADQMPARATLEDQQKPYRRMGLLLRQQPRGMVYNLVQYGEQKVWTWGTRVGGHSWRMTGDIQDSWADLLATGFAMAPYASFVGPGRFNDPDMLMLGVIGAGERRNTRLTPDEQYTQVSLWSLLAAPLVLGNHLGALDEFTRGLLTNSEVIAINQDARATSAVRVLERGGWQVWVKELEGGGRAVGVFNMGPRFSRLEVDPALFGRSGQRYQPRDAWRQRDLPARSGNLAVAVPSHGVALFTIR
jgi:hypothetical protein